MNFKIIITPLLILFTQIINLVVFGQVANPMKEDHRPQIHFSPKAHWTNDPNGMVYYKGVYHLFFQYYPDGSTWGPMHWGHATSTDLAHWKELPIAIYPDSLGYIFSGSAVVDKTNSSGFGVNGEPPLVAIYTNHNQVARKEKRNDYQNQSIAYSSDNGITWKKYSQNPVLKNPGITDFRDPKVMWYEPQKKWIMTLATKDRVTFYSSPDLKTWQKESDFGSNAGCHDGVWECPDLFSFDDSGKKVWVLIVNINPGGPNKGSATQYFIGDFDGKNFISSQTQARWLDYGPDEYAGITWSNTGNRKLFIGWMSNWLYANVVPTTIWRNAMTIPRELKLKHLGQEIFLTSEPAMELNNIEVKPAKLKNAIVENEMDLSKQTGKINIPCRLNLTLETIKDFSVHLSNETGEEMIIGFDKKDNQYYIDRTNSGKTDFQKDFAAKHVAPRFTSNSKMDVSLVIDVSSVELFADDGLTVMTEIFFPQTPYNKISIRTNEKTLFKQIEYAAFNSIWP